MYHWLQEAKTNSPSANHCLYVASYIPRYLLGGMKAGYSYWLKINWQHPCGCNSWQAPSLTSIMAVHQIAGLQVSPPRAATSCHNRHLNNKWELYFTQWGFTKFNHPINPATFTIWEFPEFTTLKEESSVTPINILSSRLYKQLLPSSFWVGEATSSTKSPMQCFYQ